MAEAEVPKKKSKLKWIILIVLLLLIGGGGAGAWFFVLKDKLAGDGEEEEAPKTEQVQSRAAKPIGTTVALSPFTVNLADPLGQRFIRINLEVEVSGADVVQEIGGQNARIRDSIILLLSSKTYADIATPESKLMLKSEITDRLGSIIGPEKIYQVFITDIVIQ